MIFVFFFERKARSENYTPNPLQISNQRLGVSQPESTLQGSVLDNFRHAQMSSVSNLWFTKPISCNTVAVTKAKGITKTTKTIQTVTNTEVENWLRWSLLFWKMLGRPTSRVVIFHRSGVRKLPSDFLTCNVTCLTCMQSSFGTRCGYCAMMLFWRVNDVVLESPDAKRITNE